MPGFIGCLCLNWRSTTTTTTTTIATTATIQITTPYLYRK
jgi:hypothetical protein